MLKKYRQFPSTQPPDLSDIRNDRYRLSNNLGTINYVNKQPDVESIGQWSYTHLI